jgi:hypothetical protein
MALSTKIPRAAKESPSIVYVFVRLRLRFTKSNVLLGNLL